MNIYLISGVVFQSALKSGFRGENILCIQRVRCIVTKAPSPKKETTSKGYPLLVSVIVVHFFNSLRYEF